MASRKAKQLINILYKSFILTGFLLQSQTFFPIFVKSTSQQLWKS